MSEARIPGCCDQSLEPDESSIQISPDISIHPVIHVEKWRWTRFFTEIWLVMTIELSSIMGALCILLVSSLFLIFHHHHYISLLITAITLSPTLQCPFNDVLYRCHSSHQCTIYIYIFYITISQHKSDIKWVYSRATCTWPSKNLCPSILAKISSEKHLTYSNPSFLAGLAHLLSRDFCTGRFPNVS